MTWVTMQYASMYIYIVTIESAIYEIDDHVNDR